MSCWMDELLPPNSSDLVHGGGTISKDEVILFPWGLLEHLLAQMVQAARDHDRSKPWVTQICSGSRSEQRRRPGRTAALFTLGALLSLSLKPFLLSLLPSMAQDAPAFLHPLLASHSVLCSLFGEAPILCKPLCQSHSLSLQDYVTLLCCLSFIRSTNIYEMPSIYQTHGVW